MVELCEVFLNNFEVSVTDVNGYPVEDIIVTLVKSNGISMFDNDEIFLTSLTNEYGIADFYIEDYSEGTVYVTSRAHNYLPEETSFNISEDLPELVINENTIVVNDEQEGNGDGKIKDGKQ